MGRRNCVWFERAFQDPNGARRLWNRNRPSGGLARFTFLLTSYGMGYSIEYFHARVQAEIESRPVDMVADYARVVELLIDYGPKLGLPHSRALGDGLFELRARGKAGVGRAFYCFLTGQRAAVLHAFLKKTRKTPEHELRLARKRMKEIRNG